MQIWLCDSREVMWRHQRSPKMFLPIASHRKELQHREWPHCVQLIKTHRMICILTLRSRNLRSPLDLDLMRSWYTYFDAYQRKDLDCAVSFAQTQFKSYWKKTCSQISSAAILTFLTPVTSFFTLPKMTSMKIVELVRPYPMPFTVCL